MLRNLQEFEVLRRFYKNFAVQLIELLGFEITQAVT